MGDVRWSRVVGAGAAVAFSAPLAALVVTAFADRWRAPALLPQEWGLRGFDVAFSGGGALAATGTSLVVALVTTAVAPAVAWPAARALGERRHARPGPLLVGLALPLLVPPYAAGFGLTEWFIRLDLAGTVTGLVAVHVLLALPYAVVVLVGAFGARLRELEEMARTFGGSPARRWATVTLPSVAPTLSLAALLAFLVSWSQYGSSLAVGAGRLTLPVVMFPFLRDDPQVAAALAMLFLAPALLVLALAARSSRSPL